MAIHNERGKEGELLACEYLLRRDYNVELRNWRSGYYEIDIIATKEGIVHFVEVKTRHNLKFGYPEESVSKKKFNNLKQAASCFLSKYPHIRKIQFDILSILREKDKPVEFFLIEDVYM
jgi:putative endonuclease